MDYLDLELMQYQNDQDHRCDVCGEYCDEEWTCGCCQECEQKHCECEDEDVHLGI